jgi:very-short-patch-repair endonuclease
MRACVRHRRELRRESTDPERAVWRELRDRRFAGFKFRRQHSCGPFILDFFCQERLLAVELDGGQHFEIAAQRYDERRSEYLRDFGIRVLRFSNDQIAGELPAVLEEIARALGVGGAGASP